MGVENVIGGSGADVLKGSPDVNRIVGGPGADELLGKDGDDGAALRRERTLGSDA